MDLSLSSRIANGYGSNNGANCYASVNQGSQSIDGNYTVINYSMSAVYFCNAGWTWGGATRTNCGWFDLLINGVTVATIGLSVVAGWGNGTSIGSKSGTYTVTHNSDGTKSVSVQIRVNPGTDPLNGGVYYQQVTGGAQTLTLSTIPRTSKVSISPSSIECNGSNRFTINTNRASSSFTHTITYGFGSASGTIATGVGASTTWAPPANLLNQFTNASSGWGTITCKTYNGNALIGTSTVNFTLTAGSVAMPTLSGGTLTEQVSSIVSHAGSNVTLQTLSRKTVKCNVSTKYGASVASVTCSNGNVNVGLSRQSNGSYSGTISGVSSGTYVLRITDTRGLSATQTITQTYYSYSVPTITNIALTRDDETGSNGKLTANGKFSPVLDNSVTIVIKRTAIADQTLTRGGTSGTWSVTQNYTDLYYNNSYSATITISDEFTSANPVTVKLGPSTPIFAIGRNNVYINGKTLLDWLHPVGSYHISDDPTNPADLFGGGTWEKIEGRFLFGSSATYGTGSTGGEERHILSASELPVIQGQLQYRLIGGQNTVDVYPGGSETGTSGPFTYTRHGGNRWRIEAPGQETAQENTSRIDFKIGGGQAHNIMPPYRATNIWRRTA